MPLYELKCSDCGHEMTITCRIRDHEENVKSGIPCACGGIHKQFHTGAPRSFLASSFPRGNFEHIDFNPTYVRDKRELRDICEEKGLVSRLVEDA